MGSRMGLRLVQSSVELRDPIKIVDEKACAYEGD